jgi:microcystin-dependent protein
MSIQQQARGTNAAWESANPILASAEIGYIIYNDSPGADNSNAGKFKIGDGSTPWIDLPIASGEVGPTGPQGTYYIGSVPPEDPDTGDMWFNDTNAALSIYYDSFWVETTGQQGPTGPAPITSVSSPLSITGPTSAQTISIPDASEDTSGVVTTGTQTIAGDKTFSGTISLPSTTSIGNVSADEIGYVDGVTSAIQTQINTNTPTGAIMMWYTDTAPTGWLICNGQSTSGYDTLASVVGANVPNLQGRVAVGRDSAQTEFDTVGETGGSKTHTLTVDEMPSHNHSTTLQEDNWFTAGGSDIALDDDSSGSSGTQSYTSSNTGGGLPHNNLQPYVVLNYIIKT